VEFNYLPPTESAENNDDTESFIVDGQTLKDLGLEDVHDQEGFFSIFGKSETKGGKAHLEKLFHSPTRNKRTLENRQKTIIFLQENKELLRINRKQLDFISYYLVSGVELSAPTLLNSISTSIKNKYQVSNNFYIKETGIRFLNDFLQNMDQLSTSIQKRDPPTYIRSLAFTIQELVNGKNLRDFVATFDTKLFSLNITQYDFLLRKKAKEEIIWLLDTIYELEAYLVIGKALDKLNFSFPEYIDHPDNQIEVEGLFHAKIPNAVTSDLQLSEGSNLCFLTGANMAGKSSFLKAFGIAIYLAHLGFPVPATSMKLSIYDGLVTTINLSDNLQLGLSHFSSEVKRVKKVANQLSSNKRLVVIFDELFRGTNVKDASRASSLIIGALAKLKGSALIISTHIIEIAKELEIHNNIIFKYFETKLINNKPIYTHKLKDGVSTESLGLNIVLKEQIIEILEGKLPPTDAKNP
ncbi:MAG: hypothetical protein OEZ47_14535, partial [Gammaproteobacteria bacterium]|nr:hypothetical protein [Gammaproteobacteria bacterium]